ncbi:hypothetical protein HR45_06620 [Shewanella mangrovi]|uniref:Flagellar FliJ protein n=1 Tax=Shewanella mangrovi TaxID=1515746 RepID=A0A094JJE2_9GAMM|nr:hypothetical protein [Shewanella mangrovi]KFZ38169.1 hypothetical protein HR45_06620 [Shewanella mangrovi]
MKSLAKYMELQQRKLEQMQQQRRQLQQQQQLEQTRLAQLTDHIDSLAVDTGSSALLLQNMAQMKHQMQGLYQQQQQRITEVSVDARRQQLACNKQAGFNLGLEKLLRQRQLAEQKLRAKKEQRQLDELVTLRFRHSVDQL